MAAKQENKTGNASDQYTLERVRQSFERLVTVMETHSNKTLFHSDWFIAECLNIAAEYIDKLDVNSKGFRIASHELYLQPKTESGKRIVSVKKLVGLELHPYPIASIAHDIGANEFAKILCDALDKMSLDYEKINVQDGYIPEYMDNLEKAKVAIHTKLQPTG